jgi:hypothetical protein
MSYSRAGISVTQKEGIVQTKADLPAVSETKSPTTTRTTSSEISAQRNSHIETSLFQVALLSVREKSTLCPPYLQKCQIFYFTS